MADVPMLRHVTEPVYAGGLELRARGEAGGASGVGREAASDRREMSAARFSFSRSISVRFFASKRADLRRLPVEEAKMARCSTICSNADSRTIRRVFAAPAQSP